MNRLLAVALIGLVAAGCDGDSGGGDSGGDRVGVVIKGLDNPFFAAMEQGARGEHGLALVPVRADVLERLELSLRAGGEPVDPGGAGRVARDAADHTDAGAPRHERSHRVRGQLAGRPVVRADVGGDVDSEGASLVCSHRRVDVHDRRAVRHVRQGAHQVRLVDRVDDVAVQPLRDERLEL